MFLPSTPAELKDLGWDALDIILITGDSYIDSPYVGVALIGRVLQQAGYRVGVIAQPDINSESDITRLGEPRLFWGISGGCLDSMVANYTALKKKRRADDYTPGGRNEHRPDRAVIVYSNLVRRYFKKTCPLVLGGLEASLRRVAHYDFWSNSLRSSILLDAKADYLLYGMADKSVVELAAALRDGSDPRSIRGLCYMASESDSSSRLQGYLALPSFAEVAVDKEAFIRMFNLFYQNSDALTARGLYQPYDRRYLVHNPPSLPLTQAEMDAVYGLDFTRQQHPFYASRGPVKALETIRFAIPTHRGCYGECNFCSIAVHEGRTVQWRSAQSIEAEARHLTGLPDFKGYIVDVGGPSANMYGFECRRKLTEGACRHRRCLFPSVCPNLQVEQRHHLELLRRLSRLAGVKKVFVASGIRYDLLLADRRNGPAYLKELVSRHVSGQMKVAPEHTEADVLAKMGKPGPAALLEFKELFDSISHQAGLQQYLTYYLIAAHPGCTAADMQNLRRFTSRKLKIHPEQVQIFIPLPSTYSALMYYTGQDPFTGQPLFVEKDPRRREEQKQIVVADLPSRSPLTSS
jgi:uncharacterized radical SAM protein YgiQ